MVPVVPLFSTQHKKGNTDFFLNFQYSQKANSKNTIFQGLVGDGLCQISSLVKYRRNKPTNKSSPYFYNDVSRYLAILGTWYGSNRLVKLFPLVLHTW